MKKLIFLSGNANCGKTTSLKYLIGWFLNLPQPPHSVRVVYCSDHARLNQLEKAWAKKQPLPKGEFSVVLEIDGIRVGIWTEGDRIGSVWNGVTFFERRCCDIGIVACHPWHLDRSLHCLVSKWANHRIFSKTPVASPNLQDQENQDMAQKLFHEVMATIKSVLQSTSATPSNP